ncbi:MAG: Isoquinoline 1-oxidoreductase subunit [Hyphomicrobium sp.]|uniref:Isoquinoline 1-oxidoreductase subunit n=1 Tax=Hyphomicrobium sp. TaxID=82 RepID=UPI001321CD37|nr:Isoquinoline 1-oxidoreductase subunit [Hyphomicrobium sp.]KAB2940540.1 MAG: Isoquinoline 1-oxidoreductase subunit [Hyphomicrobium sp.]MBZ0210323.1 Isoquinoline 1-oxidoreductase subunit [Hyphomicrobium sp.]
MRPLSILLAGALVIIAVGVAVSAAQPDPAKTLKSLQSFASIADERQRSLALFQEVGKVLTHARCLNCHPAGDRPMQGDNRRPHMPLVVRGVDNFGAIGMRCTTCHGPANFDPGGVPGHPAWHLAPIEMAWVDKSLGEICEQIKDPNRNGGKSMQELVHHMAEDSLVGWGWHPGAGREPVPGTQQEFGALFKAWVDTGAVCPAT